MYVYVYTSCVSSMGGPHTVMNEFTNRARSIYRHGTFLSVIYCYSILDTGLPW